MIHTRKSILKMGARFRIQERREMKKSTSGKGRSALNWLISKRENGGWPRNNICANIVKKHSVILII